MMSIVSQVRVDPVTLVKLLLAFKAEGIEVDSRAELIRLSLKSLANGVDVPDDQYPKTAPEALRVLQEHELYKASESRKVVIPRKEIRLAGKALAKGEDVPTDRAADIASLLGEDDIDGC